MSGIIGLASTMRLSVMPCANFNDALHTTGLAGEAPSSYPYLTPSKIVTTCQHGHTQKGTTYAGLALSCFLLSFSVLVFTVLGLTLPTNVFFITLGFGTKGFLVYGCNGTHSSLYPLTYLVCMTYISPLLTRPGLSHIFFSA